MCPQFGLPVWLQGVEKKKKKKSTTIEKFSLNLLYLMSAPRDRFWKLVSSHGLLHMAMIFLSYGFYLYTLIRVMVIAAYPT